MKCSDLFHKYTWEEINPTLIRINPTPKRGIAEYQEVYQHFLATMPSATKMRILIEVQEDNKTGEKWYYPYGKDGTLVKDSFHNSKAAYEHLKDRWEEEQSYGLSYTSWAEVAGMEIDPFVLASFPEKEVIVHLLFEITVIWRNDEESAKVLKELHAIKAGMGEPTQQKKLITKSGFLQVWSIKESGTMHGFCTSYWQDGSVMRHRCIYVEGSLEGVLTSWNNDGKVKKQIRFWCDRAIEEKIEPSWWEGAEDQS